MFSKKLVTGAAGLLMIAGTSFGAVTAHASGPGTANCTVTGSVDINGGATTGGIRTTTPYNDTFKFKTVTITCTGADAIGTDDNGTWAIDASGNSYAETCARGAGGGTITSGGTSPNDGTVDGGIFGFHREGANVTVWGTIHTAGVVGGEPAETHSFNAALTFTPTTPTGEDGGGNCDPTDANFGGDNDPTIQAAINGSAAVTE